MNKVFYITEASQVYSKTHLEKFPTTDFSNPDELLLQGYQEVSLRYATFYGWPI